MTLVCTFLLFLCLPVSSYSLFLQSFCHNKDQILLQVHLYVPALICVPEKLMGTDAAGP